MHPRSEVKFPLREKLFGAKSTEAYSEVARVELIKTDYNSLTFVHLFRQSFSMR